MAFGDPVIPGFPQARIGLPAQAAPDLPTYPPEEEKNLLLRLGQKALAGLGFLGQSIDKAFGARAVRGVLGGKPRELLSLIPFSDTLGISNPDDIVYGRDLLEHAGILDRNTPGFDAGDLAGFATDVLLDPASYLAPGANTLLGRSLAKRLPSKASLGDQVRGAHYLESQVGSLEPARLGVSPARDLVPPGSTVIPAGVQAEVEKEVGRPLQARYQRVAGPAQPIAPPAYPSTPLGLATQPANYEEALSAVSRGEQLPPGRYVGAGDPVPSRGYSSLDVAPPPQSGQGALEANRHLFSDVPTGEATPLRALLGISPLPFGKPSIFLGTGETSAKILDWLGGAGDWLKKTGPIRYARTLFSPPVEGTVEHASQEIAANLKRPLLNENLAEAGGQLFDLKTALEPLYRRADKDEVNRLLVRSIEGLPAPADQSAYVLDLLRRDPRTFHRLVQEGKIHGLEGRFSQVQDIADTIRQYQKQGLLTQEQELGLAGGEIENYFHRLPDPLPAEGGLLKSFQGARRQPVGASHSAQISRQENFKNFPEGTTQVNELLKKFDPVTGRPLVVGPDRVLAQGGVEDLIRQELTRTPGLPGSGSSSRRHLYDVEAQFGPVPQVLEKQEAINRQARNLAEAAKDFDPRFATLKNEAGETVGHNFFRQDPLLSVATRANQSAQARASAGALYEGLRDVAKPAAAYAGRPTVPVGEVLKEVGLTRRTASGESVAEQLAAKAMGIDPAELHLYQVPAEVAQDLSKWLQGWTRPQELAPVLQAFDDATNLMKAWLTLPFPAFHTRNVASGVFNMWRDGALSTEAMRDAKNLLLGHPIEALPGMAAGTREQVMNEILKEIYSQRVAFTSGARSGGDILRSSANRLQVDVANVPGRLKKTPQEFGEAVSGVAHPGAAGEDVAAFLTRQGLDTPDILNLVRQKTGVQDLASLRIPEERIGEVLGSTSGEAVKAFGQRAGTDLDFWPNHIAGVGQNAESNTIIKSGRDVSNAAEDWLRVSHYIAKRRQGYAPEVAAEAVRKYHFDYGDATQFERSALKRFIPFYQFSRKNLPPILEDLATQPAKLAAATRLGNLGQEERGLFVPPYIAEGTNVGIPGAPEGSARFVASLGLPMEDEFVKAVGSLGALDFKRATGEVLGGLNPFLKYPIEHATGVQLHTGRELRDLRTNFAGEALGLGNENAAHFLTQLLANSPASRFISSTEKLIDDRKDIGPKLVNLLTGARITDVDLAKQQEIAARATLQEILKDSHAFKTFEDIYVKPDKLPDLSPEELTTYALYKQIQKRNEKEAAQRRRIGLTPQGAP